MNRENVEQKRHVAAPEAPTPDHTYALHCAIQRVEHANPDAASLGEGSDPQSEALSIKAHISDAIPDHEIERVEMDRQRPVIWTNLVSLGGRGGPLPEVYTDMLKERLTYKDNAFRDFLDIFNHRLASLWYRLKKKTLIGFVQKPPSQVEVGQASTNLAGVADTYLLSGTTLSPHFIVAAQTLLWAKHRSLEGLQTILTDYFGQRVGLEPWQGGWNEVHASDVSCLGGPWNTLGKDIVLGRRSWHATKAIRVHVYDLDARVPFSVNAWRDVICLYIGVLTHIRLRLHYLPHTVPHLWLSTEKGSMLGQNTWLAQNPRESCVDPHRDYTISPL